MTDKEKEREKIILQTADRLNMTKRTQGWEDIYQYAEFQKMRMKNELAQIDLDKKLFEAAKIQGRINAMDMIFNRINNVIKEAEIIRERKKEKKEKK